MEWEGLWSGRGCGVGGVVRSGRGCEEWEGLRSGRGL